MCFDCISHQSRVACVCWTRREGAGSLGEEAFYYSFYLNLSVIIQYDLNTVLEQIRFRKDMEVLQLLVK